MSTAIVNRFGTTPTVHPIAHHACRSPAEKDHTMAAPFSWLKNGLAKVAHAYRNYSERRIDRQAFQHMIALDDAILKDIGVSRADVIWASRLPLSKNAAAELQLLALQNKNA